MNKVSVITLGQFIFALSQKVARFWKQVSLKLNVNILSLQMTKEFLFLRNF